MSDIKERIAALPEWVDKIPDESVPSGYVTYDNRLPAALARLALAQDLQPLLDQMREAAHLGLWHSFDSALADARVLLAALEVPRG